MLPLNGNTPGGKEGLGGLILSVKGSYDLPGLQMAQRWPRRRNDRWRAFGEEDEGGNYTQASDGEG